jgi:hypothetical protein
MRNKMTDLKQRYAQLFGGKSKSNDKQLTEGFIGLSPNMGRRPVREEEVPEVAPEDMSAEEPEEVDTTEFDTLTDMAKEIRNALSDAQTKLEELSATDPSLQQRYVQFSRYSTAVLKNLTGITRILKGLK